MKFKLIFLSLSYNLIINSMALNQLIINHNAKTLDCLNAIRVMSYNIRVAPCIEDDHTENAWVYRLPKIQLILDQYIPDLIGLQECSELQTDDLKNTIFRNKYSFMAQYPTNNPIEFGIGFAYNTAKLSLISEVYKIWLNELQNQPSAKAWDGSNYERFIIYAKFKNIITGRFFWCINTHFDHLGIVARQQSAKIIMDLAKRLDAPAIITGDFNCFPQLGGAELYGLLCSYNSKIKDSKVLADTVFGVAGSWMGWDYDFYKQRGPNTSKYDFIFVDSDIKVLQHGIIDDYVWDFNLNKALYPSDHRPVISDLVI